MAMKYIKSSSLPRVDDPILNKALEQIDGELNKIARVFIDWTADAGANNIHDDNILSSSISQHEADIDHNALTNYESDEHLPALDEDDLTSNSDTNVATQQSIKAYVDSLIAGVNEFPELTDTPANYTGSAGKFVKVNATPDALEFASLVKADISDTPWVWGDVSKVGSNLTDLATRQHTGLTDIGVDDHHNQDHVTEHEVGGGDLLTFADITGFGDYLDQAVKEASSPIFANLYTTTNIYPGNDVNRYIYSGLEGGSGTYHFIGLRGNWDTLMVKGRVIGWTGSNLHIGGYDDIDHSADHIELAKNCSHVNIAATNGLYMNATQVIDASRNINTPKVTIGSYYLNSLIANNKVPDSDKLDGYHGAEASTALTAAIRNSSGDINARLFKSEYDTTNPTCNLIMTQIDTVSNNYLRPSTKAQVIASLNLMTKAGGNFTGNLGIGYGTAADSIMSWYESTTQRAKIWFDISTNHFIINALQNDLYLEATADVVSETARLNTNPAAANMHIGTVIGSFGRSTSALKYKDKIKDLELDSSLIYNLRPVSFNSLCKNVNKDRRWIGLIADEVEPIYPEIIHYNENNEVEDYDNKMLITLMLKEIQNLNQRVGRLEN